MSNAPSIGRIRLFDKAIPDLDAGAYRLATQLEIHDGSTVLAGPASQQSHLRIIAPRFELATGEISECFPPPNATGAFAQRLPQITLGRRTLPWERRIAGNHAPGQYPWLALLVLRQDEAQLATGALRAMLPPEVVTKLEDREPIDGDPPITVLQLRDAANLNAILPTRAEAALLAHVRQVNLADTAQAGDDDDGWFAVIAANRLPMADADDTPYLACLVSLEERDDIWSVASSQPAPPLIVLHSWPFTSSAQGGTFDAIAAALDAAPFGGAAGDGRLVDALGRVPVERTDHEGAASAARYRGPLSGLTDEPLPEATDDASLAAAHELGRLLGIADGRFLRDLIEWHRKAEAEIRAALEIEQLQLPASLAGLGDGILSIARLQNEVVTAIDVSHLKQADIGRLTLVEIDQ